MTVILLVYLELFKRLVPLFLLSIPDKSNAVELFNALLRKLIFLCALIDNPVCQLGVINVALENKAMTVILLVYLELFKHLVPLFLLSIPDKSNAAELFIALLRKLIFRSSALLDNPVFQFGIIKGGMWNMAITVFLLVRQKAFEHHPTHFIVDIPDKSNLCQVFLVFRIQFSGGEEGALYLHPITKIWRKLVAGISVQL